MATHRSLQHDAHSLMYDSNEPVHSSVIEIMHEHFALCIHLDELASFKHRVKTFTSCGLSLGFNTTSTWSLHMRSLVGVYFPLTDITLIRKLFPTCKRLFWLQLWSAAVYLSPYFCSCTKGKMRTNKGQSRGCSWVRLPCDWRFSSMLEVKRCYVHVVNPI